MTGSRSWSNHLVVYEAIEEVARSIDNHIVIVVHGNAEGVDQMAKYAAIDLMLVPEPHDARWTAPCIETCRPNHRRGAICPAAGVYRNQHMVNLGADICLAFIRNNSRGASDCLRRAEEANIPTKLFTS